MKHAKCVHIKERPFVCTICDKTYKDKNVLQGHMQRHSGKFRYYCDVCKKGFTCSNAVMKHKICRRNSNRSD